MRELPLFWRYRETGQCAQLKPCYLWLQPLNWPALGVLHYLFPSLRNFLFIGPVTAYCYIKITAFLDSLALRFSILFVAKLEWCIYAQYLKLLQALQASHIHYCRSCRLWGFLILLHLPCLLMSQRPTFSAFMWCFPFQSSLWLLSLSSTSFSPLFISLLQNFFIFRGM